MLDAVRGASTLGERLAAMRRTWSGSLIEIVVADVLEAAILADVKDAQTSLAEASVAAALWTVRRELSGKYRTPLIKEAAKDAKAEIFPGLAALALGKLGGRGVDYDSDLDLVFVWDPQRATGGISQDGATFGRAVELFVTAMSSMTRDGSLYRVDLRLRPYGSKGLPAMTAAAFLDYMREAAMPWEFLAFVKLRAVGGDVALGSTIEQETRRIIHERASRLSASQLADDTRRIRSALEASRTKALRQGEIDIKYGAGGMLDIYFATRYLQLRDNIPDDEEHRSTGTVIDLLLARGSIDSDDATLLRDGYTFLAALDHNIRLTVGRTTRLPLGNEAAMKTIAQRMSVASTSDLVGQLTLHRLNLRSVFEKLTS